MVAIPTINPITGAVVYIDAASGDGSQESPYVMRHADPETRDAVLALSDSIGAPGGQPSTPEGWSFSPFNVPITPSNSFKVIKPSAGTLYSCVIHNSNLVATYWAQFYNRAAVPSQNAADFVLMPFPIFPNSVLSIGGEILGTRGYPMNSGIVLAFSMTRDNFAPLPSSSDLRGLVGFR